MNDKEFEVGYDDSNCWGVFGVDSGHCYSLYSDKGEAELDAVKREINRLETIDSGSDEILRTIHNEWVDTLRATEGDADVSVLKRHIRFVKKLSEAIEILKG